MNEPPYHESPPVVVLHLEQRGDLFAVVDGASTIVYGLVDKSEADFALKDLREQLAAGKWNGDPARAWVSAQIIDRQQAAEIELLKQRVDELAADTRRIRKQRQAAGQASGNARGEWHGFARKLIPALHREFLAAGHHPDRICTPIATRILDVAKGDSKGKNLKWPQAAQVARFVREVINSAE